MKKFICTLSLVLICSASVFSQTAMSLYVEGGGPGIASLNFDTRFSKKQDGIGGRIGFGGFMVNGTGAVFIPAGITYLIGKDQKNYFEIGAGATYVNAGNNYTSEFFSSTFGHINLGYRYQPKENGIIFRAAINPIFGEGFFWPYYGGLSVGYKF